MNFDIDFIEKLAKVVTKNQLTEITLDDSEKLITIKKEVSSNTIPQVVVQEQKKEIEQKPQEIKQEKPQIKKEQKAIKSPMVGAFYAAPSPGAKPFVSVGDTVSTGQVVCIVEAMKLMNEIESEVSGKITQICVQDGQSVEYGQVLMYVE